MSKADLTLDEALRRITERDPKLHAFISTRAEKARAEARALSAEPPRSALHGLPYSLKDVWEVKGEITTSGSWRFRSRIPETSTPVHEALTRAGAILVGKTSCPDLSIPPDTVNYLSGATRNPRNLERSPGGSSGGAAAAVADGMSAFDWGTDIGGSIRMPAAFCGVYGLKLSRSVWPIRGSYPSAPPGLSFMEAQGPITGSLELMERVLEVVSPSVKAEAPSPFEIKGAVLWVPDRVSQGQWPGFRDEVQPVLQREFGEKITEPDLPALSRLRVLYGAVWATHLKEMLEHEKTISPLRGVAAALSALLLRGVLGDRRFHPTTAWLLLLIAIGGLTIFRNRDRTMSEVSSLRDRIERLWSRGQVIVMPTSTYPAPRIGQVLRNWNLLNCVIPGNLTDATALAMPWGQFPDGMPRSLQLVGPPGSEAQLIRLARRLEIPRASMS